MLRYYLLIPFFVRFKREVYLHTPAIYLTSEYQNTNLTDWDKIVKKFGLFEG